MDEEEKFCIFCLVNEPDLIEISSNAVEVNYNVIEFSEMVKELYDKKIANECTALICGECQNLLVQSYIFAQNVRHNQHFIANNNLLRCKQFLESEEEPVSCLKYNKCLILVPDSKRQFADTWKLIQPQVVLDRIQEHIEDDPPPSKRQKYEIIEQQDFDENTLIEEENWIENEDIDEIIIKDSTDQHESYETVKREDSQLEDANMIMDFEDVEVLQEYEPSAENDKSNARECTDKYQQPHLDPTKTNFASRRFEKLFCYKCSYQFTTQAHFKAHNNGHELFDIVSKYLKYPKCSMCNVMFVDEENYEKHQYNHQIENAFELQPVEGFFLKLGHHRSDLEIAEDPSNFDEKLPSCGHCGKKSIDDIECVKHLLIFHVNILTCPIDSRTFIGNQAFTIHLRNNHPELFPNAKFECSACQMNFESLYEKLAHMKVCNKKKFNCNHCSRTFTRKCFLQKHLKLISGELSIVCDICQKVCRDKHDFTIHFRSHSTEKHFKCSLCDKAYKTSSARAAHLQSHLERIVCLYCNLVFKSRRTMQKHVKTKHEKIIIESISLEDVEDY